MERSLNDDLFFHTYFGDLDGVKAALAAGADPGAMANRYWSKLYAQRGKWLEAGAQQETREALFAWLWSDSEEALFPGLTEDIAPLIRSREPRQKSVLILAATYPDPERSDALIALLLEAGASPDAAGHDGQTALHAAAHASLAALVRLLQAGADPNAAYYQHTPLHIAAARGDAAMVEQLLQAGADPNRQNRAGATPLILAAAHGDTQFSACEPLRAQRAPHEWESTVMLLLQAGADPNVLLESGRAQTAYGFALLHGDKAIQHALRQAGATGSGSLSSACTVGDLETVQRLLATGADTEHPDAFGNTPLMNAAGEGYLKLVEVLLVAGASLTGCRAEDGIDAFARAICANRLAVAAHLIAAGADVNTIYYDGPDESETPLLMAVKRGFPELTRLLLAHGADPHFQDKHAKTALDYARMTTWEESQWHKTTITDPELRAVFEMVPMTEETFYNLPYSNEREVDAGRAACRELLEIKEN